MVNNGANPYVVSYNGRSQFDHYHLENLSNLPTKQSIYYTTRPVIDEFKDKAGFRDPWFYRTGIFDGKFNAVIGRGASGTVFSENGVENMLLSNLLNAKLGNLNSLQIAYEALISFLK